MTMRQQPPNAGQTNWVSTNLNCSARRCTVISLDLPHAEVWLETPLASDESAIAQIADWGPAEDWSDWADA